MASVGTVRELGEFRWAPRLPHLAADTPWHTQLPIPFPRHTLDLRYSYITFFSSPIYFFTVPLGPAGLAELGPWGGDVT